MGVNKKYQKALLFLQVELGGFADYIGRYFSLRLKSENEKSFNSPRVQSSLHTPAPLKKQKTPKSVNVFTSGTGGSWTPVQKILEVRSTYVVCFDFSDDTF